MEEELHNLIENWSDILDNYSPEVQDLYKRTPRGIKDEALAIFAKDKFIKGDLESGKTIINQIEDDYEQTKATISLAIAEYKSGNVIQSEKRVTEILKETEEQNLEYQYSDICRYFLETNEIKKITGIIDSLDGESDQNTIWEIVEPLAQSELKKGNYQFVLSLEKYLVYDIYSISLISMVARRIGHKIPEESIKLLEKSEQTAENGDRDTHITDRAWAFIGHPERAKDKNNPYQDIELAKHYFIINNPTLADAALSNAIAEAKRNIFYKNKEQLALIFLEIAKVYKDYGNHSSKIIEYLDKSIENISLAKYNGIYQEDFHYEKDNICQQIEETILEENYLDGMKKITKAVTSTGKPRVQLKILELLLKTTNLSKA